MKLKISLLSIFFFNFIVYAAQIDTVKVFSKSMNKSIANVVITPKSYTTQKENYAVVYLLHGAGGDHSDWIQKVPKIQHYADQYNLVIVCPNGGYNSWYFDSPVDEKWKYETYISKELITAIDSRYRTKKNRKSRAITGLSMGGHGAFYLSFSNQNVWGAAGSMSGGVDLRPFPKNWSLPDRLGDYAENQSNWENNTVINMVYKLKGDHLKLIFDCGTGDFFFDANKRLHQKLLERNIPHDYIERPGAHNWDYWANAIKSQLLFFNDFFKS
jgi:S-formylglutathione hydrolase FrmB|tara:strand:+ start:3259 stop:4071 length:813 start_codon:yes stop_codon:yes gene_type:complete